MKRSVAIASILVAFLTAVPAGAYPLSGPPPWLWQVPAATLATGLDRAQAAAEYAGYLASVPEVVCAPSQPEIVVVAQPQVSEPTDFQAHVVAETSGTCASTVEHTNVIRLTLECWCPGPEGVDWVAYDDEAGDAERVRTQGSLFGSGQSANPHYTIWAVDFDHPRIHELFRVSAAGGYRHLSTEPGVEPETVWAWSQYSAPFFLDSL